MLNMLGISIVDVGEREINMPVALITGASRGLGLELAKIFAKNGYDLILGYYKDTKIGRLVSKLMNNFHDIKIHLVGGDVCAPPTVDGFVRMSDACGLDVLINNAGIYISDDFPKFSDVDLTKIIDTNLLAPMRLTKALWPFLKKSSGTIVNINSIAGIEGRGAEAAYSASKFGLRGFSQSIQFEATRDKIRVLNVTLGAMNTDMMKGRIYGNPETFLINPQEAAESIASACITKDTLRVTEMEILRRNYI